MSSRLDGLPVYQQHAEQVSAEHYNIVQIALKRLEQSIRIELPTLRTLDLILDHHDWIVVDRSLSDIPVLAWTDFQHAHRSNLHEPLKCTLKLYHAHAEIIIEKVMEAMDLILGERLADQFPQADGGIIDIGKNAPDKNN